MNNIQKLLAEIENVAGAIPQAFSSRLISELPAITYTTYLEHDDGVVETWRFQTRITAESLEECIGIDAAIRQALCTIGDEELHDSLSIQVNGGGTLEDEATGLPQLMTYYDINTKS